MALTKAILPVLSRRMTVLLVSIPSSDLLLLFFLSYLSLIVNTSEDTTASLTGSSSDTSIAPLVSSVAPPLAGSSDMALVNVDSSNVLGDSGVSGGSGDTSLSASDLPSMTNLDWNSPEACQETTIRFHYEGALKHQSGIGCMES